MLCWAVERTCSNMLEYLCYWLLCTSIVALLYHVENIFFHSQSTQTIHISESMQYEIIICVCFAHYDFLYLCLCSTIKQCFSVCCKGNAKFAAVSSWQENSTYWRQCYQYAPLHFSHASDHWWSYGRESLCHDCATICKLICKIMYCSMWWTLSQALYYCLITFYVIIHTMRAKYETWCMATSFH